MEDKNDTIVKEPEGTRKYQKVSYWSVVWSQFKKNKTAIWGLWAIGIMFVLAVYSPLIAFDVPFTYSIDGQRDFPFLKELFNVNRFENSVDIFFNILMVASPLYIIAFFLLKKVVSAPKIVVICMALSVVAFIFISLMPTSLKYTEYKLLLRTAKEEGKATSVITPPVFYSYRELDQGKQHPQAPSKEHLIGTDAEGRDVFARMLYGTRISMTIGLVAVSIYMFIGIVLGSLAGYFGGAIDLWISRIVEVVICFPTFFLILTIAAFIEKRTIFHVMILIGVVSWTGVARLVRGEFLRQRGLDYVQAAIALGISRTKIIFGHILPNAMGPILVSATFGIASAILTESGLSFLGLGDPTAPSWGGILNIGRQQGKLWLILAPGLAIFVVVSLFNLVGEAVRDAMDPRLRQ